MKLNAAVGVMLLLSVQELEKMVPRFFDGTAKLNTRLANEQDAINKNIHQPTVDDKIKNLVRRNMTR